MKLLTSLFDTGCFSIIWGWGGGTLQEKTRKKNAHLLLRGKPCLCSDFQDLGVLKNKKKPSFFHFALDRIATLYYFIASFRFLIVHSSSVCTCADLGRPKAGWTWEGELPFK